MWLDEDISVALEWDEYRSSLCSGCGQPKTDGMNPDAEDTYEAVPLQCFPCAAREAEGRRASEAVGNDKLGRGALDGIYYAVMKKGTLNA